MRSSPDFGACGSAGSIEAISASSIPARDAVIFFIVIPPWATFLFVVFRRKLEGRALRRVVIDPELRLVLGEETGDALIRPERLLAVDIVRGYVFLLPALLDVHRVAREQLRAELGQLDQQNLVPGSVARRRDDGHAAVAEYVMIALELGHRMRRLETRAGRRRPVIFSLLHEQHGLWEQLDIADMVRVRMRYGQVLDIGRLQAELLDLAGECLGAVPVRRAVGAEPTVGHAGDIVGNAGVPHHPALCVANEIAVAHHGKRLAHVDAGCPARLVGTDRGAAVDDVEALDRRFYS